VQTALTFLPENRLERMPVTVATRARAESRADVIKALSHPSRLLIAELLGQKECCVGEITAYIGCDTSTVSKHLALMKAVGLVSVEKRGLQQFYRLVCPCLSDFFSCVDRITENRLARLGAGAMRGG